MNVIVLDVNQGAWKLETERGVIMDGDKSEHLLEAIPVMGCYCDLIGVRSFATFESRKDDYEEKILKPIYPLLWQARVLYGECHGPSLVEFCRPDYHRRVQTDGAPQGGAFVGSSSQGVASGRTQQFRPMDERRRRGFRRDASRRL